MPSGWFNLETAGNAMPENQLFDNESAFSFLKLTRTQRLYGFIGCLCVGLILSILGTSLLFLGGQIITFVFLYTLGIIISLIGTGFLIGFASQLKQMFAPVRIVATIILVVAMGLVFVGAFVLGNPLLCIIFVVIEYLAYTWYCLSYIPYARAAILKMIGMG